MAALIQQRHYRYNATGLLSEIQDSRRGILWYDYEPLDKLTAVRCTVEERFEHDVSGNVLGMYDVDTSQPQEEGRHISSQVRGNRLYVQGDRLFSYDAFGNLVRERRGKGHKLETRYQYDCLHRLTHVHLPNGTTARYSYDPFGRRYRKQVGDTETRYFWQGERLITEEATGANSRHSTGAHYRSFIYELLTFRPLFDPRPNKASRGHQ